MRLHRGRGSVRTLLWVHVVSHAGMCDREASPTIAYSDRDDTAASTPYFALSEEWSRAFRISEYNSLNALISEPA
jgi:hypothetical protein